MIGAMLPMLVAAAPMQQRADFAASAELVSFARDTGPATASAPGPDVDRYLLVEHDGATDQLVVTGLGVVAHGAPLPKPGSEVIAVIRTSKSAPSAADAVFADNANITLFIVNGKKVWEIGRQGGAMRVRTVAPTESPWKPIG
jgi:hypothetical protein